jgi:hypothetical protein
MMKVSRLFPKTSLRIACVSGIKKNCKVAKLLFCSLI